MNNNNNKIIDKITNFATVFFPSLQTSSFIKYISNYSQLIRKKIVLRKKNTFGSMEVITVSISPNSNTIYREKNAVTLIQ